ncbi:Speckle targeted PIP5K1A-regulated poly(A) polymerase [Anthophora retusa]
MSNYCEVCSMYFQDEHSLQSHLAGKKHLKKLNQRQVLERSIVVSPIPKCIFPRGLINIFQQYGAIKRYQFNPQYLEIEFHDRNSADYLLKKPIWVKNVKLNIEKGSHNNLRKQKSAGQCKEMESLGLINFSNIEHIFNEDTTFDDQLQMFLNAVQLTNAEIETRYESVCTELDRIFRVVFPKCKTYKFGSIQTGLGFKECDLDIYMDVDDPTYETKSTSTDFKTTAKIFKKVKEVLYKMNCVFSKIVLIPKAKTPIIKFWYLPTEVSCDLSFKNGLGISKSYFIKYCISLDSRIRPLIMLIKYWARHFKISGTGKICNYALVLLTIFYLQQPSVNIIPPLTALRNSCEPRVINGWQVNFNENTVLPPVTNQSSVAQLLHGFFIFYATFEFKSHVICPIDGMIHTDLEFKEVQNLPSSMDTYKAYMNEDESLSLNVNKPMCVQDPIELNHNVTSSTQYDTLNTFVKYCALGIEICTLSSKNEYKTLMKTLLSTVIKKRDTFNITICGNQYQSNNGSDSMETCTDAAGKSKFPSNDWYFTVFNIVKDIFEQIVKVQTEILTANVGEKQQKFEILSDVHMKKYQKIIFHCTGSHCVWRNRKVSNIILDPSLSCLRKEAFISEQTIECHDKTDTERIHLDFLCTFKKKDPNKVILILNNHNSDEHIFKEFKRFAEYKLAGIIKQTLLYMQQFNKCY